MVKLTRKTLQKEANRLGAYKLGSNVYKYENAISKLYRLKYVDEHDTCFDTDLYNQFVRMVKAENVGAFRADVKQMYYSSGVYGNSGQLHEVRITDINNKLLNVYFVYYC